MIKLSSADIGRATEALSFRKMQDEALVKGVSRLSSDEAIKLASATRHAGLSEAQIKLAERLGRELAHVKHASSLGSALVTGAKAIGRRVGKSFKMGRTRDLAKPMKIRRQVKGKRHTVTLKGMEAFGQRFMQQPGRASVQVAKDVAPIGAAALGVQQMLSD